MCEIAIQIDQLTNEIARHLTLYTKSVDEGMEVAKDEVTKEAVEELKQTSRKLTGSYAKGWRVKKVGNTRIVHNATDYQLTHLLEYGHVNRDGSRARSFPHIRPVEEVTVKSFMERVDKAIKS